MLIRVAETIGASAVFLLTNWGFNSLISIMTKIHGSGEPKATKRNLNVVTVAPFVSTCGSKGPRYMQPKMVLKSLPVPWVRLVGKI